jgi:hypothetical protein
VAIAWILASASEQGYAEIRAAKAVDDQSGVVLPSTRNVVAGKEAVGTETALTKHG